MAGRKIEYRTVLKPSVERLVKQGHLMVGTAQMAVFLGVSQEKVHRLRSNGRLPLPIRLGLGQMPRWSVYELLEWVEAGCPPAGDWIKQRGWSGWVRNHASKL